jgi:hypothetical protein
MQNENTLAPESIQDSKSNLNVKAFDLLVKFDRSINHQG